MFTGFFHYDINNLSFILANVEWTTSASIPTLPTLAPPSVEEPETNIIKRNCFFHPEFFTLFLARRYNMSFFLEVTGNFLLRKPKSG